MCQESSSCVKYLSLSLYLSVSDAFKLCFAYKLASHVSREMCSKSLKQYHFFDPHICDALVSFNSVQTGEQKLQMPCLNQNEFRHDLPSSPLLSSEPFFWSSGRGGLISSIILPRRRVTCRKSKNQYFVKESCKYKVFCVESKGLIHSAMQFRSSDLLKPTVLLKKAMGCRNTRKTKLNYCLLHFLKDLICTPF